MSEHDFRRRLNRYLFILHELERDDCRENEVSIAFVDHLMRFETLLRLGVRRDLITQCEADAWLSCADNPDEITPLSEGDDK